MKTDQSAGLWEIAEEGFPWQGTSLEKWQFLLGYAVLAPSSHNAQPWLFRCHGEGLELYADRTRSLRVCDPEDRELIIGCGAALGHLLIAMRHFSCLGDVEVLPDRDDPDLLARVQLGSQGTQSPQEHLLFQAIVKRRTNRLPFRSDPVPPALLRELEGEAWRQKVFLHILEGEGARYEAAGLVAQGDRIQWANKRFRLELSAWVRPSWSRHQDGIPGYAQGMDDLLSYAGPLIVRTFDMGEGQAAKDREVALGSPLLAVLGTTEDAAPDWMAAGQALARILLRARVEDIWASFLNQPIEVPELRVRLGRLLGRTGVPQLLLRLGFGNDVRPTPRRPVEDVLV